MAAAIFNGGTAVKILKDLLRFKSGQEIITNISDANVAAGRAAPQGSFAVTTEGNVYQKDGALDTNWNPIVVALGKATGQSIAGGVGAGEDLSLDSTTNATKGRLLLNSPVNFNIGLADPAYSEGNAKWNSSRKTLDIQTGISDTVIQVGQELYFYVFNDTGGQLDKGRPVYVSGVNAGTVEVSLAGATTETKKDMLGTVAANIPDQAFGFVTRLGLVENFDTSSFSIGPVYLSDTDGVMTQTRPTGSSFRTKVGEIIVSDVNNGVLLVDPISNELTAEVTNSNGFPDDQLAESSLSFVDGTRTFTIAPTGAGYHFYQEGIKYIKSGAENVVIADVEGIHAFFYDLGVLTTIANPTEAQFEDIVLNKCFIAILYWDANSSISSYFGEERHGISMSPRTHAYLHVTRGAQYVSGMGVGDIVADDTGNLDAHAQFSVGSGVFFDEDITNLPQAVLSTAGLPIYYVDGAAANLRRIVKAGFSVVDDVAAGVGATGRLVWNEDNAGTWQLTTVSNNSFVLCHVFASNGIAGRDQHIAIIGQSEYATQAAARAGAEIEISNLLVQLPLPELVPVATVIFQTSATYSNAVKARIRTTDSGDDFVDWRTTELAQGATPSSHNNLANLQLANTGVTYGHINDQAQPLYGQKDFINGININSTTPVDRILDEDTMASDSATALATQQSIKAYIDSALSGGGNISPLNYITNFGAESDLSGWGTYQDPDSDTPTDGGGGTPNVTLTRETASPLRGNGMFRLSKDAASRRGEGAVYQFTLDRADIANEMTVKFDYETSANYADNDIEIFMIASNDNFVTDFVVIPLTGGTVAASGGMCFSGGFFADDSRTEYRMCIHVRSTSALSYTFDFDTVLVVPSCFSAGESASNVYLLQDFTARNDFGTSGQQRACHAWEVIEPEVAAGETLALWHFGDTGSGDLVDETANGNDLTTVGTVNIVGGIFGGSKGGADVAVGTENYLRTATLWDTQPANAYTVQMLFSLDTINPSFTFLGSKLFATPDIRNLKWIVKSDGGLRFIVTNGGVTNSDISTAAGTIVAGGVYLATFTLDPTNGARIFLNGNTTPLASDGGATFVSGGSDADFSLGNFDGDSNSGLNVDGKIFYTRVVDKVVDGDFIRQSYATRYAWTNASYTPSQANITFIEKDGGTGPDTDILYSALAVNTTDSYLYTQGDYFDKSSDLIRVEAVRA